MCGRILAAAALALLPACARVVEPTIAPDWTVADAAKPLSHADCARLATHQAATAAAWSARRDASRAALRRASTLPNPTASLSFENLGLGGVPVQTTLSLAMALAAVAARPRERGAAAFDLEAQEADLVAERRRLSAEVWRAYDELVVARRRAEVAAETEGVAARRLDATTSLASAGEAVAYARVRAHAELSKAKADRSLAEAEARVEELTLAAALGFDRPVTLRLSEGLFDLPPLSPTELDAAAKSRAEVAAAAARYAAQLERAHLANSGFRFVPAVAPGIRREASSTSAVFGLDVEIPLFDAGCAARAAASADLLAAAAELRRTVREGSMLIAASAAQMDGADAYLRTHARPIAEERRAVRETAERLFGAGELDYDEVVSAARDEVEARGDVLTAELTLARARVALWAAADRLDAP